MRREKRSLEGEKVIGTSNSMATEGFEIHQLTLVQILWQSEGTSRSEGDVRVQ